VGRPPALAPKMSSVGVESLPLYTLVAPTASQARARDRRRPPSARRSAALRECGPVFAASFNGDLSFWDVSSVTDMHYMFDSAATETSRSGMCRA